MGNTPVIVEQADALCKVLAVLSGNNGKIDTKLMNKCEDDIEMAFQKDKLDDWRSKYEGIYGKDNMKKADAIQYIIQGLMNDSKGKIE